jgi:DNA-binding NtrC family response regulator
MRAVRGSLDTLTVGTAGETTAEAAHPRAVSTASLGRSGAWAIVCHFEHEENRWAMVSVLLVEDEPGIQLAIRGLLRREGHETSVASSGADALALLSEGEFDLVLTDLSLPGGVSGLDLVRHVGASCPGTPVVLITAFGSEEIAQEAVSAGAFGYVPKPFNNDEIRAVVRSALAAARGS